MKIAILGAGAFGTALGGILADNGYDIDYYDKKIEPERLQDTLFGAKIMVLCIPSIAVPFLLPHLPKNIPLLIATKGLLGISLFKDFSDIMILSGPGFADDIKARKRTFLTSTDTRIDKMFAANYIKFDHTDDEQGVLLCGALKNVFAIQAGLLNLEKKSDSWKKFIEQATLEMKSLLEANGASSKTVDLACGIGDLELTCDTPSRNYQFGQKLRTYPNALPDKTVEGLTALRKIKQGKISVPDNSLIIKNLLGEIKCL